MKFDSGTGFEVSSSKLHIKTDGDVVVRKVDAEEGTIGGFNIANNAISSSGTFKRGLVLKPGDSISGFGNSAHKTTTVAGQFTFGVGSIAPAAGADTPFDGRNQPQPPSGL